MSIASCSATYPLIVAARLGDVPLVNLLLERGAQVDIAVLGDGSPLIAASMLGNLEIVTTLVERGADVKASCSVMRPVRSAANTSAAIRSIQPSKKCWRCCARRQMQRRAQCSGYAR
ncbi:MAG: ankyrin repeat domain-containing protein [Steroidobacteraceae bacterium]